MTALIVIPTLNEAAHIEACLRSLLEGDDAASKARVLVMDGGSSDDTCAIVQRLRDAFPRVEVRANPRRIQSAAINIAARAAAPDEEVLIRCDAHALYPKGYVSALLAAMAKTGADSVVVPMDAVGQGCFQRAVAWIVDTPLGSGGAAHRGGVRSGFVDHGHHAAFKLARFLSAGGYDESFTHNEDAEFDRRLTLSGGRIWLDADIRIGYFPRATPASLWRQYRNYGSGRAAMLAKHKLIPKPRQMIPVVNLLLLLLAVVIAPIAPISLVWPGAYLVLLVGASLSVSIWKRSLCGLGAGLALAIIHVAWAWGFLARLFSGPKPQPVLAAP